MIKITLHTLKNIKIIFVVVLLIKLFVLIIDLSNQLFFTEEKSAVYRFIEAILKEKSYCKNIIKNILIRVKCWICDELFDVTGKYRGSAHWSCIIKLTLTKKVPVIFYNLEGYDTLLIMQEIGKFDVKVNSYQVD